jgi:hypothetical protein
MLAGLLGLAVALAVVAAGSGAYLQAGYLPPAAAALTVAVEASQGSLSWGALIPGLGLGALLQLLGGPTAHLGLLFSTGLLIDLEPAGWALLWGLLVRTLAALLTRGRAESPIAIFGVGCIGGEFLRLLTGSL